MKKRPSKSKTNSRSKSWEDRESRDDRRDSRRRGKSKSDDLEKKGSNDPKWYATDPALLRDSSSIPFSWPLGQNFKTGLYTNDDQVNEFKMSIPGICAVELSPCYGPNLGSDALNVAASAMYTFIRHTNAGHANYDPNDLMLYVIAMTNVYSYVNYLERIYAIATLYEQRNRYMPDGLFTAMHINGDSIKNNLADFRYRINVLINKVSSIAVPATMTIFLRQAMLYAYVYCEGESVKDQLYLYYPKGFYKFGLDADGAGQLALEALDYSSPLTWEDLCDYGEDLFSAVWNQEDFGIMSGDILKSYGNNILSLSSLEEVVPFAPVYDPLLLHQIKNATIIDGRRVDYSTFTVTQNAAKSRLLHAPATTALDYAWQEWLTVGNALVNKVLTVDAAEPTPEMVMECTRLMAYIPETTTVDGHKVDLIGAASEIVTNVTIYGTSANGTVIKVGDGLGNTVVGVPNENDYKVVIRGWAMIRHFKFMPRVFIAFFHSTEYTYPDTYFDMFEVDNYAVLDGDDVGKMHTAAILNMLNVPSVAKNVSI